MRETDVEVILQRAKEKYPEAKPRIISDNGPQFIARDFKEFIRISGMTHVRTSPLLSTVERQDRALAQVAEKRVHSAGNAAVAGRCTASGRGLRGTLHNVRLNSATGYLTPKDMLAGRQQEIHADRDRKLEAAQTAAPESRPAKLREEQSG